MALGLACDGTHIWVVNRLDDKVSKAGQHHFVTPHVYAPGMSRGKRQRRRRQPAGVAKAAAPTAPEVVSQVGNGVLNRRQRWTQIRRAWGWAGWHDELRLMFRALVSHPGLLFGWLGVWVGAVRLLHRHRLGWPAWPVTLAAGGIATVAVGVLAASTYKAVPSLPKPPRRHFAVWAAVRLFVTAVMALYVRQLDPTACATSNSSTRCALYDTSAAVSFGFAFLLGGLLASIVALTTRRTAAAGSPHMGRWRSTGWSAAAAISIPMTVALAAQHPWVRDTIVAVVVFLGLRSVLRVLSLELTGLRFDDLVVSWREVLDQ